MGRRKAEDGADHLSAMVRRKNAVNEELTLAAMSEDVWAAVESGKERRRRLACEREYGVGGPGAKPVAAASAAPPAKPAPVGVKTDAPVPEKAVPAETRPAPPKKEAEPTRKAAPATVTSPAEAPVATKKGKAAKDVSKSHAKKAPSGQQEATGSPQSSAVPEKKVEPEAVKSAAAQPAAMTTKEVEEEIKPKNDKPTEAAASLSKPADSPTANQNEEQKQATPESKKSKRGKKKGGRPSESDDKPGGESGTTASAPEAPLASNLPQMVSDEPSRSLSASLPTPLSAAPVPTPSVTIPTALSYAEKAKHPPASPPHEELTPSPPRQESPEPLYDPTPRAHSPPPAPALAPCSPVTEEWMPVETRKEKRRRRRSERASESERKSESAAEPDAFDLLLSGGEGLHDGLQEALDEEDVPAPPPPPAALTEPADAFDLLMSAADDFGEGFQEAFGDEEDEPVPAPVPARKKDIKETARPDERQAQNKSSQQDDLKPAKKEQPAAPVFDAFDLMLGGDDGLKEGFEQAFADEETEETPKSPVPVETKKQEKGKVGKHAKENKREQKTSQSDKKSSPVVQVKPQSGRPEEKRQEEKEHSQDVVQEKVQSPQQQATQESGKPQSKNKKPRSRKNSEKTKEKSRTPRQSTCSESEPVTPVTAPAEAAGDIWFDKSAHDEAEVQFYEEIAVTSAPEVKQESQQLMSQPLSAISESEKNQGKGKKPRSRKNSEKKQGRTPRQSTCSESESPAQAKATATWFDKAMYDAAETQFYEGLCAGSGEPEKQQEVLKKTSATPVSQPLSCSSPQRIVEDVPDPLSHSSVAVAPPATSPSTVSTPAATQKIAASSATSQSSSPRQTTSTTPPTHSSVAPVADAPRTDICSPPMSLSSQPEQYFEDVVLAARKSSATMAELPGFTAAPLSERLAPGEQLDSLRTEPELEPDDRSELSEVHKAGKKRQRRRRRRSDRTSESDRKSESEPAPPVQKEAVVEANSNEAVPSKAAPDNTTENGTEPKSHQKSNKSRHQRRKKTKSTCSASDPTENGVVAKEPVVPSRNEEPVQVQPQAPATSVVPTINSSPTAKPVAKSDSPSSTGGSDSQPSSPEHVITSSPEHDGPRFVPDDEGRQYASLLQQDADTMLPARPVFLAHACFVCKRLHSKQCRLKSCGSCRLVAYCSATHQRAHWPLHRSLCKVITKRMKKLGTDHLYREAFNVSSHEQWKQVRFKHMTVCEEMLGRPMEAYEKEMFLYPRACETCHETTPEKLHTCHSCHSVSFCSEEHLSKNHSKFCKDLRLLVDIHTYQNQHGVCDPLLPDKMLTSYEHLPANTREFLVVSMLGPVKAYGMGNIELAVLSEQASYPLSLLYALQNIPVTEEAHISQMTDLTIHVVGAEFSAECDNVTKWDVFLLNVLPRLKRLHVVFIGPELEIAGSRPGVTEEDFTCDPCRKVGKRFTCEFQPNTYYHTYCRSPQFRPPQAICAFNAGIYRTTGHDRRDSWRETIPFLVRDGVPLVLTAYTLLECPQDVARIQQEQKVDVLLPPTKNPYRSARPAQNFLNEHESPLIYKNQYVACLSAARPRK